MIQQADKSSEHSAAFAFRNWEGIVETREFANPVHIITTDRVDEVMSSLESVEHAVNEGYYAAGFLAYEAAPAFDPLFRVHSNCATPLLWFGIYQTPTDVSAPNHQVPFHVSDWHGTITPEQYARDIERIRHEIEVGNTYQVNYTLRMSADFRGDDYAFYQSLCDSQNSDYCAYLNLGRYRLLSASPELFFHRRRDQITTKPMKGTVARGRYYDEDMARKTWLGASEKNRAENVMIVDLLRNDLGRIAKIGSVHVDDLFQVEPYRTVYQMTSKVSATLPQETSIVDIFRALFPCGSITGAPKISTMRIITELEDTPRQAYCGAIGYITPTHEAIFNVAIRTVTIDTEAHTAEYGIGGGITWDSNAADEYHEAMTKAAILRERWPTFDLLETFALRDGKYVLLERHLERVLSSAAYFAIPVQREQIIDHLFAFAENCYSDTRVRLLVSKTGAIKVEGQPLGKTPMPAQVGLAKHAINREDKFLFHKTTHRTMYEVHKNAQPSLFDILLWNERREITEFTMGNVIVELDGKPWTPPVDCGLLPGTLRAELLHQGLVRERIITIADLENASQIWFINSVRGQFPVTFS